MRDFRTEYKAFLQQYPFQTIDVNGVKVRYQYGGKEGAPVVLFLHGLEMHEMWMKYALHLSENYRFLNYEYPMHTIVADEQIDFAKALLRELAIDQVILLGASDGGVYAQIFAKRHPEMVKGMCITTTLTLDSDYIRNIQKERFTEPFTVAMLRLLPAKMEMKMLLKKSPGFLACESPENQEYGRTFYETVASDLEYKQRFIHSYECVYMLKDYPYFQQKDFEYLRGKIQVLIPDDDIFKKEDQQILETLFEGLDADILHVPGGHVGMIVQAEDYLKRIDPFLARC